MARTREWSARLSSFVGGNMLRVRLCGEQTPRTQLGRSVLVELAPHDQAFVARMLGRAALAPVLDELKRRADVARSLAGDDEGYDNFDEAENYGAAEALDEAYALLQEFVNGTFPKR